MMPAVSPTRPPQVQRQITLPLSKAVEIAYKSIRMRLSRSLLVTSGIVLALAFLMSVRTSQAIEQSIRAWGRQVSAQRAGQIKQPGDGGGQPALPANPRFQKLKNLERILEQKGESVNAAPDLAAQRTRTNWLLGLALMVAFVGILNAMLMSVTERFREIGTMKCLGALDSFIIKLFLIESLFQGAVGTVLGVTLGLAMSLIGAVGVYGSLAFVNFPAGEIAKVALLCLAVGVALTVGGALYPAWQAARMLPIEAMRADV